jgi:hypothetical protein
MFGFGKKQTPVNPTNLVRTYTRDEVLSSMALIAGVVVGGTPMVGWEITSDDEKKISVTVDFGKEYDIWDFYKAAPLEMVSLEEHQKGR